MSHTAASVSWAKRSYLMLQAWGILDLLDCFGLGGIECTLSQYKRHVRTTLKGIWRGTWEQLVWKHVNPIPYLDLAVEPSTALRDALRERHAWNVLLAVRHFIQLRCGFLRVGHINNKRSEARVQNCVLCNKRFVAVFHHVVCNCPELSVQRAAAERAGANCQSISFLATKPDEPGFGEVVMFADALATKVCKFWN